MLVSCGSEYFEEMLRSGFKERVERRLVMKELTGDELELMLESVYGDGRVRRGKLDESNCFGVFLKANQFLFPALQAYAETVMCKFLDDDNVLDLLSDDIVRLSPTLKRHCLEYVAKRFERLETNRAYQGLPSLTKLEIEHFAAKQNEEMFMALIATLTESKHGHSGKSNAIQDSITDFNTLVREEIVDFLESQVSNIDVPNVTESVMQQVEVPRSGEEGHRRHESHFEHGQHHHQYHATPDSQASSSFIPTKFRFQLKNMSLHPAPNNNVASSSSPSSNAAAGEEASSASSRAGVGWSDGHDLFSMPSTSSSSTSTSSASQPYDAQINRHQAPVTHAAHDEDERMETSSDSDSSSSSHHLLLLPKDSISAVFTPTKLSILAKDISLLIKDASYSIDAVRMHPVYASFSSSSSSENIDNINTSSPGALSHELLLSASPNDSDSSIDELCFAAERLDSGSMDVLLCGVSFALSFTFSIEKNFKILEKIASASISASRKKEMRRKEKKHPSPYHHVEGFHPRHDHDDDDHAGSDNHSSDADVHPSSSSSSPSSSSDESSMEELLEGLLDENDGSGEGTTKSLLSLHNFSCDIDQLKFKVDAASRMHHPTTATLLSSLFSTHFKNSLRQHLLAAFQANISDSLSHLTDQLNTMGAKQLSRLTSFPGLRGFRG